MYARTAAVSLSLLAFAATSPAIQGPARTGAVATPANRIVGLWSTQGTVSGCATGVPVIQVRNNVLYHAGGTATENIAPTQIRNQGLGVWSYDQSTGLYTTHFRFDRFANGIYSGYTIIDKEGQMSADGQEFTGPVRATLYAPDGHVIVELCGEPVSERLY